MCQCTYHRRRSGVHSSPSFYYVPRLAALGAGAALAATAHRARRMSIMCMCVFARMYIYFYIIVRGRIWRVGMCVLLWSVHIRRVDSGPCVVLRCSDHWTKLCGFLLCAMTGQRPSAAARLRIAKPRAPPDFSKPKMFSKVSQPCAWPPWNPHPVCGGGGGGGLSEVGWVLVHPPLSLPAQPTPSGPPPITTACLTYQPTANQPRRVFIIFKGINSDPSDGPEL